MPKALYIFGSGGHGKVVASILLDRGITPIGFLDEDPRKKGTKVLDLPVLGGWEFLETVKNLPAVIVGIGENKERKRIFEKLREKKIHLSSAIHPSAILHSSVQIGEGSVGMPGVIVNVGSRIGKDVILNTGVSVDHDCLVSDHAHLAPGCVLAGGVTVEEGAFLGVGARVIPGIRVGAWATVGAGAAVLENVPAGEKVGGVPARSLL